MKAKNCIFLGLLLAGFLAAFSITASADSGSDATLDNIQALSLGETGGGVGCPGVGKMNCPYSSEKVYAIIYY